MEPDRRPAGGVGPRFRKMSVADRRNTLQQVYGLTDADIGGFGTDEDVVQRANVMVEQAVGYMAVPMGVASGFLIDGNVVDIPMATEEPSVIAAASFAAGMVATGGGFETAASAPVMAAQIYIRDVPDGAESEILAHEDAIRHAVSPVLARMEARGGGLRSIDAIRLPDSGFVRVQLHVDVRNAMGANILNSAAEAARSIVETITGGTVVMAILSNMAEERIARAEFAIPKKLLARGTFSGDDVASRIVDAFAIADEDPARAVTHNKGILNGISALALATANDTRGIEAAAHCYASRSGRYRSLTSYSIDGDTLQGRITVPLPFGTVGGAVNFHPGAKSALKILGEPDAVTLSRIAASVGLAQNLAALAALVSEGIQKGHMRLHARRVAFEAGARDADVTTVARRLQADGDYSVAHAQHVIAELRNG